MKIAFVVAFLLPQADEVSEKVIEQEILGEVSKAGVIPYATKVEKVIVITVNSPLLDGETDGG